MPTPEELNSTTGLQWLCLEVVPSSPARAEPPPPLEPDKLQSLVHTSLIPSTGSAAAPWSWGHQWLLRGDRPSGSKCGQRTLPNKTLSTYHVPGPSVDHGGKAGIVSALKSCSQ